jgi:hypothetical protein
MKNGSNVIIKKNTSKRLLNKHINNIQTFILFIYFFFQKDTDQVQHFLNGKLSMLDSNTKMSYFQLQMTVKFNKFSSTYLEFHYRKTKVLLQDYYIFKNKSLNPEHLSTSPVNCEVRVAQYLVVCVLVCPFTLDHCIVCSSSIYVF